MARFSITGIIIFLIFIPALAHFQDFRLYDCFRSLNDSNRQLIKHNSHTDLLIHPAGFCDSETYFFTIKNSNPFYPAGRFSNRIL